jgi:DNA-binding transcriptional LysR family regulator
MRHIVRQNRTMLDHLTRLAVLGTIADAGSLSEAARQLGMSKSVLSHHIASLEKQLGSRLLDRSGHRASLTPLGRTLAAHGRTIALEGARAVDAVRAFEQPFGILRISMPSGVADLVLIPMLAEFLSEYPDIRLEIVATDSYLDLDANKIDLAFRVGVETDSHYVSRRLMSAFRIFCASPAYLERAPPIRTLQDLTRHPFVAFITSGMEPVYSVRAPDGSDHEIRVTCRAITSNGLSMREWCVAGVGLARMPQYTAAADIAEGRLIHILPGFTSREAALHAVFRPDRLRPANVNRLLMHAEAWFKAKTA